MSSEKRQVGFLIVFLVFLIIISLRFDYQIVSFVSSTHPPSLDLFMTAVTFAGSTLFILFFLTSLFLWHERKRRWIIPLWISLGITSFIVWILKIVIPRLRPYQSGTFYIPPLFLHATYVFDSSFPSLHAAAAFSALPVLDKEFPYFRFLWLGFACLVAFSRVYFAVHYLSDVLIGAIIGYLVGFIAVKAEEKYKYSSLFKIINNKGRNRK